jgi:ADP-heptose:LPS heptosyltransferase
MYHDLSVPLAGAAQCLRPAIEADTQALERMRKVIPGGLSTGTNGGDRLVLIHPGVSQLSLAKGVVKTWGADNWCQLILKLAQQPGIRVAVAGGPDDAQVVADIFLALQAKDSNTQAAVANLMGVTSNIADLVALIALCDLLVCVDSAPMHLAVALNKPLVALFGPTDPNKLLWPDKRFACLRDEKMAAQIGNNDPFKSRSSKQPQASPQGEPPPPPRDVEIQPDIVFRTAMDQLRLTSIPNSSQESHR